VSLDEPETGDIDLLRQDAGPEHLLGAFLNAERLRWGLAQLTEDQQEVIILRFIEGYSTAEVATMLGKNRGAIRGLQFRGLAALRDVLLQEREESATGESSKDDEPR
jgi:RNA polymerase sigma-70 factor (ECF subfamily)